MNALGALHQGRKSYVAGALTVLLGVAVAMGYAEPNAQTAGAGLALVGLLGIFLRAGGKKAERWIEERTGIDIPDEAVEKLADKAAAKIAEQIQPAVPEAEEPQA